MSTSFLMNDYFADLLINFIFLLLASFVIRANEKHS